MPHTCDAMSSFTQVTTSVKAGHSYTLTLTDHDDHATGDGTWTFVDDVATF